MGVTGLWRLIEPAGKPVPVETLENKVLAVDISIWLHQMVKGYQDAKGAPLPNAHLMGLFQRLCKLLYFRIKPVFVFDGAFPELKRETIAKRQDSKAKYNSESERLKRELAFLLSKKTAVSSLLGKQISPKKGPPNNSDNDDLFKLPALPEKEIESESESDEEDSSGSVIDLHSVDVESDNFKSLPTKEKYNLLLDLKETRKMNSWGRLHELPKKSDNFSNFQMERLLKRRKVQECLQETEKEMGDVGMSLNDLESLLNEEGIETKIESLPTRRIASNNTTRILMINNVKEALAAAKLRQEAAEKQEQAKMEEKVITEAPKILKKDELEEDLEKAIKLSLECVNDPDIGACTSKTDDSLASVLSDTDYSDSEEEDGFQQPDNLSTAKAYIMQYSDFTHKAIDDIISTKPSRKKKSNISKVDQIIKELKGENSVIVDKVDLSSSDDDYMENPTTSNKDSELEIADSVNMEVSVEYVDDPVPTVISLDSSTEAIQDKNYKKPSTSKQALVESDSSDDDFEEVSEGSEVENEAKPVVQVTVNVGDAPDDDIFADIFHESMKQPNTSAKSKIAVVDVKQALDNIKMTQTFDKSIQLDYTDISKVIYTDQENRVKPSTSSSNVVPDVEEYVVIDEASIADSDEDIQKAIEMSLECVNQQRLSIEADLSVGAVSSVEPEASSRSMPEPGLNVKREPVLHFTPEASSSDTHSNVKPETISNVKRQINMEPDSSADPDLSAKHHTIVKSILIAAKTDIETSGTTIKSGTSINTFESEEKRSNIFPKTPISTEQLNSMAEQLQNEEQDLIQEKGRLDRIGRNITEEMTKEAQELLQIFGIPYIVAPMEAEAQCAFLESVKLTDGTITDDSDIWLFGGRNVYKNFFNQKKHVMQFVAERIEKSFNLSREQLILLALLVGSDYTTGVTGVGPVTALEILATFPFKKKLSQTEISNQARYAQVVTGLQEFKKWVKAGKRTDNNTLKKKLKNVDLTDDFPSARVVQAYLEPKVEKSEEKFTWGELDITVLRDYAKAKFGWSQHKLDEIIKPVLKRISVRKNQKSMQDYFKRKVEFQSLEDQMSKRVKAAVQRMGPEAETSLVQAQPVEEKKKAVRKRKASKTATEKTELEDSSTEPPSAKQQKCEDDNVLKSHGVKVVSQLNNGKSGIEINIPKSDRYQEVIPQREKDKQSLLQNKMKAIEVFRKTKMDRKKRVTKRRVNLPKEKAELSESSDSN